MTRTSLPGTLTGGTQSQSAPNPFTEFMALEMCLASCEAYRREEINASSRVKEQISECIAVSEAYVAALGRESLHVSRMAALCVEVFSGASRVFGEQGAGVARECSVMCRTCSRLLERRLVKILVN